MQDSYKQWHPWNETEQDPCNLNSLIKQFYNTQLYTRENWKFLKQMIKFGPDGLKTPVQFAFDADHHCLHIY